MRTMVGDSSPLPHRFGMASSTVCSSRMCAGASASAVSSTSPTCGTINVAITRSQDIDGRAGALAVSSSTKNRRSAAAASALVRNPPRQTWRRPRAPSATEAANAQPFFRRITVISCLRAEKRSEGARRDSTRSRSWFARGPDFGPRARPATIDREPKTARDQRTPRAPGRIRTCDLRIRSVAGRVRQLRTGAVTCSYVRPGVRQMVLRASCSAWNV